MNSEAQRHGLFYFSCSATTLHLMWSAFNSFQIRVCRKRVAKRTPLDDILLRTSIISLLFKIRLHVSTGRQEAFASLYQSAHHTSNAPLSSQRNLKGFWGSALAFGLLGNHVITTFSRSLSCRSLSFLSFVQFGNTVFLNTDDQARKHLCTMLLPQPAALWRTGHHWPRLSDRRSVPLTVICACIVQDESTEVLHFRVTELEDVLARCCRLHNQQRFEELGVLLKTVAEASAALGQMVGGTSAGMKGEVERAIRQSEGRRKVNCAPNSFFRFPSYRLSVIDEVLMTTLVS
jgi:hypothetical protein